MSSPKMSPPFCGVSRESIAVSPPHEGGRFFLRRPREYHGGPEFGVV